MRRGSHYAHLLGRYDAGAVRAAADGKQTGELGGSFVLFAEHRALPGPEQLQFCAIRIKLPAGSDRTRVRERKYHLFIICLLLWLLFNGRITWEILAFGIAVSAAVTWLYRRLTGVTRETERRLARKIPGFFRLLAMLLREVFRANLAVIRRVYGRKKPDPCLASFRAPLETTAARVALSDCITLTPGTITAGLDGEELTVHCLDRAMGENLERSCFVKQLQSLERRDPA